MIGVVGKFRSFDRPVRLLAINQFAINIGFYMLMPYLATHLSLGLGLAGWLVGLILGMRNFSQQGMFLLGGALADRFGYKPLIVAGCALRTFGFVLLGVVSSVPALIIALAATGFAGALFNPAVRAYVADDAGERRVEAFAVFNVFYQAGILIGPLIGIAATAFSFRLTCITAAIVFAGLTIVQLRSLPTRRSDSTAEVPSTMLAGWRTTLANRRFLAFAAAMTGSYVLLFQMYLALPLETRRLAPSESVATVEIGVLFAASGLIAIAGQVRLAEWFRQRWSHGRCITIGLLMMGAAFSLPIITAGNAPASALSIDAALVFLPLVGSAMLLTLGSVVVFPFEMDTVVTLAGNHLVATHYGLYSTICGVGIAVGNLATGAAVDAARGAGVPWLPWVALTVIGGLCAAGVHVLAQSGKLTPYSDSKVSATA